MVVYYFLNTKKMKMTNKELISHVSISQKRLFKDKTHQDIAIY